MASANGWGVAPLRRTSIATCMKSWASKEPYVSSSGLDHPCACVWGNERSPKTIRGSAGLPRQWVLVPLQVTVSGAQYSTANPPLGDPFSAVAFFPIDGVSQCNPEGRWVLLNIHPFATLQTVLTARYGSANGPVGEMVPPDIPPDTVDALTCRSKYTIGPVIQKTIKANLVDLGWPAFRFTVAK